MWSNRSLSPNAGTSCCASRWRRRSVRSATFPLPSSSTNISQREVRAAPTIFAIRSSAVAHDFEVAVAGAEEVFGDHSQYRREIAVRQRVRVSGSLLILPAQPHRRVLLRRDATPSGRGCASGGGSSRRSSPGVAARPRRSRLTVRARLFVSAAFFGRKRRGENLRHPSAADPGTGCRTTRSPVATRPDAEWGPLVALAN